MKKRNSNTGKNSFCLIKCGISSKVYEWEREEPMHSILQQKKAPHFDPHRLAPAIYWENSVFQQWRPRRELETNTQERICTQKMLNMRRKEKQSSTYLTNFQRHWRAGRLLERYQCLALLFLQFQILPKTIPKHETNSNTNTQELPARPISTSDRIQETLMRIEPML